MEGSRQFAAGLSVVNAAYCVAHGLVAEHRPTFLAEIPLLKANKDRTKKVGFVLGFAFHYYYFFFNITPKLNSSRVWSSREK